MKLAFIFVISMLHFPTWSESSLYSLSFASFDGSIIRMSEYKNKKIIVKIIDANSLDQEQLVSLNALYKQDSSNLTIILIPVVDLGGEIPASYVRSLFLDSLHLSFKITQPAIASKHGIKDQHPLISWLTNKEKNNHFEGDADTPGEIYLISEQGRMFADLKNRSDVTSSTLVQMLSTKTPDN